jgi:hypothetical protein
MIDIHIYYSGDGESSFSVNVEKRKGIKSVEMGESLERMRIWSMN